MNEAAATACADYIGTLLKPGKLVDDRLFRKGDAKIHRGRAGWLMKTACSITLSEEYAGLAPGNLEEAELSKLPDSCFKTAEGKKLRSRLSETQDVCSTWMSEVHNSLSTLGFELAVLRGLVF